MNGLIRKNIENTIATVERELEDTRYWINKMEDQGFDVTKQKLKQATVELRLSQLRGLL